MLYRRLISGCYIVRSCETLTLPFCDTVNMLPAYHGMVLGFLVLIQYIHPIQFIISDFFTLLVPEEAGQFSLDFNSILLKVHMQV